MTTEELGPENDLGVPLDEPAAEWDDEAEPVVLVEADVAEKDEAEDEADGEPALDELEAEELEMLTDDETSETLVVDEAAELLAIRKAELAMEREGADGAAADEFVCSRCFLVLKVSQLADKRRKICKDCAG